MFRPAKINHINLYIPKNRYTKLINILHEKGICQVNRSNGQLENIQSDFSEINEIKAKLESSLNHLEPYKKVATVNMMKSLFNPKPPKKTKVRILDKEKILNLVGKEINKTFPQIDKRLQTIEDNKIEIQNLEYMIDIYRMLPNVPTSTYQPTQNLCVNVGLITNRSQEKITQLLKEQNKSFFSIDRIDDKVSLLTITYQNPAHEVLWTLVFHQYLDML
jgi:vacuolar-type H+-ATPase subunit I/STV1